ncbi:MAG: hypothetical protein K5644_07770 [Lachnospiraceae bacterium]|nr:hypothetical protein [Lachnospiraceae bacterium]
MKRTTMKRKALAVTLSLAMVMTCALSLSMTVFAGSAVYTDSGVYSGGTATQDALATNPDANKASIDVQAKTSGSGDIKYSVTVAWGDMQFEYDYGATWDPSTHTYSGGSSGTPGGGPGWNTDYLDGIKNKITVTNDSNFPINANFGYANTADFGTPTSGYAVNGVFMTNNDTLVGEVTANDDNPTSFTTPTLALNTCITELTSGDKYYSQNPPNEGVYVGSVYFSLMGTPARGLAMTTMQSVGTITVTITPATSVTSKTKA